MYRVKCDLRVVSARLNTNITPRATWIKAVPSERWQRLEHSRLLPSDPEPLSGSLTENGGAKPERHSQLRRVKANCLARFDGWLIQLLAPVYIGITRGQRRGRDGPALQDFT
jgi:hypothetical protein